MSGPAPERMFTLRTIPNDPFEDGRFRDTVKWIQGVRILFVFLLTNQTLGEDANQLHSSLSSDPTLTFDANRHLNAPCLPLALYPPEVTIEAAHEQALRETIESARALQFSHPRLSVDESYVGSETDDGFSTSGQLEIPLFQKRQNLFLEKIACLDLEGYQAHRDGFAAQRLQRFYSLFYELQTLRANFSRLVHKKDILFEFIKRETTLVRDKLKTSEELQEFQRSYNLMAPLIEETKEREKALQVRLLYLTGQKADDFRPWETVIDCSPIPLEELDSLRSQIQEANPEIRRLRAEQEKQQIKADIAGRKRRPEISVVTSYRHDPRFVNNTDQIFAGIHLRWDLWDFGFQRHEMKKEKALLTELDSKITAEQQQRLLRVDEAFSAYKVSHAIWRTHLSNLSLQKESLKTIQQRFQHGESSWKELFSTKLRLLEGEMMTEKAMEKMLKDKTELLLITGWMNNRTEKTFP